MDEKLSRYVALRLTPTLHQLVEDEAREKCLKISQLIRLALAERYSANLIKPNERPKEKVQK